MKILAISDETYPAFWESYRDGCLKEYDLIISCGDLNPSYLSFIVTMARCPVLYVHGNHDEIYSQKPPLGCDCIEDKIVEFNGIKILGLGGSRRYRDGAHQYSEKQMRKRIRKLRYRLWRTGGVDIVVTHAPPEGVGDAPDHAHRGFDALHDLLEKYTPKYLLHGHVHLNYGIDRKRERTCGETTVINTCQKYVLQIDEGIYEKRFHNRLRWLNGKPKLSDEY